MQTWIAKGSLLAFGWAPLVHARAHALGLILNSQAVYDQAAELVSLEKRLAVLTRRLERARKAHFDVQQRVDVLRAALCATKTTKEL